MRQIDQIECHIRNVRGTYDDMSRFCPNYAMTPTTEEEFSSIASPVMLLSSPKDKENHNNRCFDVPHDLRPTSIEKNCMTTQQHHHHLLLESPLNLTSVSLFDGLSPLPHSRMSMSDDFV
jgi:hypothetical protein